MSATSYQTLTRPQIIGTMTGVLLTLFLSSLDVTIVSTAMPQIIGQLEGFDRYAWVTTAYLLTATAGIPIFGKLSDVYGRKWIYLCGVIGFVAASVLCGAAQSMNQLILFRGLQGIGAGVISAITFAIVGDIFPPAVRAKYQGIFGAVYGLSSIFGPTMGGWLTDNLSWRWIFYINLPIGALAIVVLFMAFPAIPPAHEQRIIDYSGALTLLAWLIPLLLGLTWAVDYGWGAARVVFALLVAATMLVVFLQAERRAAEPVLPLPLFRDPTVAIACSTMLLTNMVLYSAILFIPLFMQSVIGVSATESGTLLTPLMIVWALGNVVTGQLMARLGRYKIIALIGLVCLVAGMLLSARMDAGTSHTTVIINMLIVGAGLGLTSPIYTVIVQNVVSRRQLGTATAAVTFAGRIGATLGATIFGSIMLSRYRGEFDAAAPATLPGDIRSAFHDPLQLGQTISQIQADVSALPNGAELLATLVDASNSALISALSAVFLLSAVVAGIGFFINLKLTDIPLQSSWDEPVATPPGSPAQTERLEVSEPVANYRAVEPKPDA